MRLLKFVFYISLILLFLLPNGYCDHPETEKNKFTSIVAENDTLTIPVQSSKHVYLILKFINISDTPAVFYTSSSLNGKQLTESQQGPVPFRTVSLDQKSATTTKTFLCKEKDMLTVFVKKGLVSVNAIKAE